MILANDTSCLVECFIAYLFADKSLEKTVESELRTRIVSEVAYIFLLRFASAVVLYVSAVIGSCVALFMLLYKK